MAVTLSDGSITFRGLPAGLYDVTVAGGILSPPKRVQIDASNATVLLPLPITVPQLAGRNGDTVSVDELTIPGKAQEALHKAYEAGNATTPGKADGLRFALFNSILITDRLCRCSVFSNSRTAIPRTQSSVSCRRCNTIPTRRALILPSGPPITNCARMPRR